MIPDQAWGCIFFFFQCSYLSCYYYLHAIKHVYYHALHLLPTLYNGNIINTVIHESAYLPLTVKTLLPYVIVIWMNECTQAVVFKNDFVNQSSWMLHNDESSSVALFIDWRTEKWNARDLNVCLMILYILMHVLWRLKVNFHLEISN